MRRWGTWKRWIRMVHALTAAPTAPARAEAWERLAVEESGFIVGQQALAWEAPHLSPGDPLASWKGLSDEGTFGTDLKEMRK